MMADVFESVGGGGGEDSPMRLNGASPSSAAATASRLYGTRSRRDSYGSDPDLLSFSSDQEIQLHDNLPREMIMKLDQMLTEKKQQGDDERERLRMENALSKERLHLLEDQLQQMEQRLREQLDEERKRAKENEARTERENKLKAESWELKHQMLERDLQSAKRETEKAKDDNNKMKKELEKTKEELAESKFLVEDLEEERLKLEKQFKRFKEEAQQDIDSSSEMVEVLKEQTEELRRRAVPRQGSLADQMVGLEEELERARHEVRQLQGERDELEAQLMAASVERGHSLLADTPSLADELDGGDSAKLLEALREQEVCNQKLRVYINGILMRVIERHPEILEVGPSENSSS